MVSYPTIMNAHIMDQILNHSDDDHMIVKKSGESTHSEDNYELPPLIPIDPAVSSNSYGNFKQMPFLRKAAHIYAINKLRNSNHYPVRILSGMPNNRPWHNYAKALHTYHVHYCYAEGYSRSQDIVRYMEELLLE